MNRDSEDLEELRRLLIQALIKELKEGDTTNVSVANSLLANNKIVVKHEEGENQHSKIKKIMKKKD
jgi:hypothetical protein